MKKKGVLFIIIGAVVIVSIILMLYNSAWDINGKSNYFLISIDDSNLDYMGKSGEKNVYTYNLSKVIIKDFFANKVSLAEALDKNQISIKRMTTHMSKTTENINGNQIIRYGFENYQIILIENNYIIGPNNMNIPGVLKEVEEKNY